MGDGAAESGRVPDELSVSKLALTRGALHNLAAHSRVDQKDRHRPHAAIARLVTIPYFPSMQVDEFFLSIQIEPLDEGGFLATSADLPGLVAQGRTRSETIEIAQDVARKLIESHLEHRDPLPEAVKAALHRADETVTVAIPVGISEQAA
jgi:antitoxin HicB